MKYKHQGGQALVMLLFFIMMGITITTAAIYIIAGNSISATNIQEGEVVRQAAEAGIEKALLQLLRNPSYTGEAPFQVGTVNDVIKVTGSGVLTIDSTASSGNFIKKVEVIATYSNNVLVVTSWKETN